MVDPPHLSAEHLGQRLEFEALISDTSASLFAAPPDQYKAAVERSLERVRCFFGADRCALLSVSADQQVVAVRFASYGEGVSRVLFGYQPCAALSLVASHAGGQARSPVRISSTADLPPEANVERESWIQMPIRSALTLPIEIRGVVSHLIVLNTVHEETEWPDHFVTRLRVLGELLAGALEREEVFVRLRDAELRLHAGAELAGLAFYEVNFAEGAVQIDDRFRDLCGVPPDREEGLKTLEHWIEHLHPDDLARVLDVRQELHDGRIERAAVEYRYRHPVRDEQWIEHIGRVAARDGNGRAVVTFGVLRDVTTRKRIEDDLRDLGQRLIRVHEEERALLARELHDDVTQRLAVLAIEAGRAEVAAPGRAQAEVMQVVREGLVRLSEDIHSLAYQLHPSILQELGLAEALRAECERRGRQGQLALSVDLDQLHAGVGRDAALCLFRVAQEALNNVARHAGATVASVTLRRIGDGVLLAVRDDGVGFEFENPGIRRRLGLVSMRERMRLVNGTLDIESAPGQGTTVVAWVPAEEEA